MANENQEFTDFEVQVDNTETAAWGGEQRPLVPPGDYQLTVIHLEQRNAQTSGNPMIAVTFEVTAMADGGDAGEQKDQRVYNNYSLSPKALGRLKALQVAAGAQLDKFVASQVFGATIVGTVVHTESAPGVDGQGNPREGRSFANVINERPLEGAVETAPVEQPKKPPITNKATPANGKAATTGAPRRA